MFAPTSQSFIEEVLRGPKSLARDMIVQFRRKRLKTWIPEYFKGNQDPEIREVIDFIQRNQVQMIPYDFSREYLPQSYVVKRDSSANLPYVVLRGQRIYFPRELSEGLIQELVAVAEMEQDPRSPHSYLSEKHFPDDGDRAVLAGGSDGIFCLSIVDRLQKAYVFEPETRCLESLRLTLSPWKSKVEVEPFYLSGCDSKNHISLDTFLKQKGDSIQYLQADVEGQELSLLEGAREMLSRPGKLRISICSYHSQKDEVEIKSKLEKYGFSIGNSKGFLILWVQRKLAAPYLRRGVVYGSRQK